jgi:hypothetical protein
MRDSVRAKIDPRRPEFWRIGSVFGALFWSAFAVLVIVSYWASHPGSGWTIAITVLATLAIAMQLTGVIVTLVQRARAPQEPAAHASAPLAQESDPSLRQVHH